MLYLLPNLLDESQDAALYLPKIVFDAVETIDGIIAESEKGARRYLKRFKTKKILQEMHVRLLNEHTKESDLKELMAPLQRGEIWGLVSDAGLPCIADPGAQIVALANAFSIPVTALPGPSSIVLALMLSGFSGQRFSFHGYLPKDEKERVRQLKLFEDDAKRFSRTHLFIETPYRSHSLLSECVSLLQESTKFCVAWDITGTNQGVMSKTIREWKKGALPQVEKKPAIFLLA
ncbi:MAG: hypothetical protein JWO53_977 [Chlamydiia bacterium]|nr:hypothetical protein [Chlamydiia bacterium]